MDNKVIIKESLETIKGFIESEKTYRTVVEYCKANNIIYGEFYNCLRTVSKYFPEVRSLYDERLRENNKNGSDDALRDAKVIADLIVNGVTTSNGTREFDLIDYKVLTDVSYIEMMKTCSLFLNRRDIVKVKKLLGKALTQEEFLAQTVKEVTLDYEFNCQKDKDGFPIKGTGRKITEEEKKEIKDLYTKYNIPFSLVNVAYDRIKKNVKLDDLVFMEDFDKEYSYNKKLSK